MTPVERLQAAIEKLELLRAATTGGEWEADWELRFTLGDPQWPVVLVDGVGFVVNTTATTFRNPDDAELIVVLHRTLDAQLAILRFGVKRLNAVQVLTGKHAEAHEHELALADAILGDTPSGEEEDHEHLWLPGKYIEFCSCGASAAPDPDDMPEVD